MQDEKSTWRRFAGNLRVITLYLVIASLAVTSVAMAFFGLNFAHARVVGGCVGVAFMLFILLPLEFSWEEQKLERTEERYEMLCPRLDDAEKQLRKANLFIKEFVGLQCVIERMKILRGDYRKRVSCAQVILREQASTEPDSVNKLDGAIRAITRAKDEVAYGELALRDAHALATLHGFEVSPIEQYLGLAPVPTPKDKPEQTPHEAYLAAEGPNRQPPSCS